MFVFFCCSDGDGGLWRTAGSRQQRSTRDLWDFALNWTHMRWARVNKPKCVWCVCVCMQHWPVWTTCVGMCNTVVTYRFGFFCIVQPSIFVSGRNNTNLAWSHPKGTIPSLWIHFDLFYILFLFQGQNLSVKLASHIFYQALNQWCFYLNSSPITIVLIYFLNTVNTAKSNMFTTLFMNMSNTFYWHFYTKCWKMCQKLVKCLCWQGFEWVSPHPPSVPISVDVCVCLPAAKLAHVCVGWRHRC